MSIKKILAIIFSLILIICLCACGGSDKTKDDNSNNNIQNKKPSRFYVTVIDQDGNPVKGVVLKIQKNSGITACTNNDGIANFNLLVTSGYKLNVVHCPDGYEYTGGFITIKPNATDYTLKITKK